MFRDPTLADIYVKRLGAIDGASVPVYEPWTPDIRVGTIARFEKGAFTRRGHLDTRVEGGHDEFREQVPLARPSDPVQRTFGSDRGIEVVPTASAGAAGRQMLTARLSLAGKRLVYASFTDVVTWTVADPRGFDDLLWEFYLSGMLDPDEVVVASHLRASAGTVIINRKGSVDIDISADAALVGGAISVAGLVAGVQFGKSSKDSIAMSGGRMTVAVQAKGLDRRWRDQIVTRKDFDPDDRSMLDEVLGSDVPSLSVGDLIGDVDWSGADESPNP